MRPLYLVGCNAICDNWWIRSFQRYRIYTLGSLMMLSIMLCALLLWILFYNGALLCKWFGPVSILFCPVPSMHDLPNPIYICHVCCLIRISNDLWSLPHKGLHCHSACNSSRFLREYVWQNNGYRMRFFFYCSPNLAQLFNKVFMIPIPE